MSNASNLTDEQKSKLGEWAVEGIGLSGIQKRVEEEFGFRMTYMDTRFLALDLGLEVKEPGDDDDDEPEELEVVEDVQPEPALNNSPVEPNMPRGATNVTVSIDELVIPGAVVSGKVTFSDAKTATWMIDNMGRFGIEPTEAGYRPNDADMQSFQQQLSELMRKKGY